jgi:hypothetical protein
MLALIAGHPASDRAVLNIARAFVRQTFPLTNEGKLLREKVSHALASNDISWLRRNMPQLPTVENPHPELFSDLDFGPLTRSQVMGWE